MKYCIKAFYKFTPISKDRIESLKAEVLSLAAKNNVIGLMILGPEGLNSTSSGEEQNLNSFISELEKISEFGPLQTKTSWADKPPFRRYVIHVRNEIVTIGRTDLLPNGEHHHMKPSEWDKAVQDPDAVVIDTRNWYETKVGKFKNAVDLHINEFTEFGDAVKKLNLPKDKKVLMYCTGGIRCEKAILEMNSQGFNNVYQLEGGILKYLEEFPNSQWDGECFVFDRRVAVDQSLQPTKTFDLCPHCGQPSTLKMNCIRCDEPATPCEDCVKLGEHKKSCSKNCAHHYMVRPKKGRTQDRSSGLKRPLAQDRA